MTFTNRIRLPSLEGQSDGSCLDSIDIKEMTNNSIQVMEDKYREELEKMKAKYKRREEILEHLYALKEARGLDSGYYMGVSDSSSDICHVLKSILSREDLTEDLRAILEKEMAAEEEKILKLQASKQKEERWYDALTKPLLDELYALDIEMGH